MKYNRQSHGVALLLALGFLSLLLVTGIAFVTNAGIAHKAAANSVGKSQAKSLAMSAVNRLLTDIRYVMENPDKNLLAPEKMVSVANSSDSDDAANTLLKEDSLLTAFIYGEKYIPQNVYTTASSQPKWTYWYNAYGSDGKKDSANTTHIIGRTAFMALGSSASVNLSEVLRGAPFATSTNTWSKWDQRRGAGMRELYLSMNDIVKENVYKRFKNEDFAVKTADKTNPYKQDFATSKTATEALNYPDYDTVFSAAGLNEDTDTAKCSWIRSWLVPGGYNEPEIYAYQKDNKSSITAYDDQTAFYHRFNLARQIVAGEGDGQTYTSVWDSAAGSNRVTVAQLLGNPEKFNVKDVDPAPSKAVPWLKCIVGKTESHDETYTPAVLRKQVAANLIDYCDKDGEATSDVSDWTPASADPTYTGHEKTPYINEVMIGMNGTTKLQQDPIKEGAVTIGYSNKYTTILSPTNFTIELINMYRDKEHVDSSTGEHGFSKSMQFYFSGETEVAITHHDGLFGESGTKTVKMKFDCVDSSGAPAAMTINPSWVQASGNYAYVNLPFPETGARIKAAIYDGETVIEKIEDSKEKMGDQEDFKVKIKFNKITIRKCYLLYDGKKADYVRQLEHSEAAESTITETMSGVLTKEKTYNVFAGFAVDDPRMNLYQKTGSVTHWYPLRYMTDGSAGSDYTTIAGSADQEKFSISKVNEAFCKPKDNGDKENFNVLSFPNGALLSTAFIADQPMVSLTELGAIHRGEKWSTLNLKKSSARIWHIAYNPLRDAGETTGYTYDNGDAAILDQVKLTKEVFTAGKVNLNHYPSSAANNYLFQGLFEKIGYNITTPDLYKKADVPDDEAHRVTSVQAAALRNVLGSSSRVKLLSRGHLIDFLNPSLIHGTDFTQNSTVGIAYKTDVQQEVIPAVSSALTSSYAASPDFVSYVIVAQSIKDVGGTGADIDMQKIKKDGSATSDQPTRLGKFDYKKESDEHFYFDEITGEVKILVTVQLDQANQKVKLLKTEFLE